MMGKLVKKAVFVVPMLLAMGDLSLAGVDRSQPMPSSHLRNIPRASALPLALPHPDYGFGGSVAIPVQGLAALSRWRAAMEGCDGAQTAACARFETISREVEHEARGLPLPAKLRLVNRTLNAGIAYRADASDNWTDAGATLATGAGDCEDYAIAKGQILARLGFAREQLQMVVVRDTRRGLMHAVLAVHTDEGILVLDNLSEDIFADGDRPDYQPVMSFAGARAFVHGFRAAEPDLNLARL